MRTVSDSVEPRAPRSEDLMVGHWVLRKAVLSVTRLAALKECRKAVPLDGQRAERKVQNSVVYLVAQTVDTMAEL